MAMQVKKEVDVQSDCSTAEVTHTLEAIKLEGQCYLKNHLLMMLVGEEGPIREWHDNVTRKNLDVMKPFAKKMGISLPFPQPLEDRENDLKAKLQNANVSDTLQMGEALQEIKSSGAYLLNFYSVSMALASNDDVRDAFRRAHGNVADNLARVEKALQETQYYYPPPVARTVGLVAEKGVEQ